MEPVFVIVFLAVLVEALIEYLGQPIPSHIKPYVAAIVGVLLSLSYNADLLAALGVHAAYPWVGSILTGLIIGRGSNYVNDLISRLRVVSVPAAPVDAVEQRESVQ